MTMPVHDVLHQGEPFPDHTVAPCPSTGPLFHALWTVGQDGVVQSLFGGAELPVAALPFAEEGFLRVERGRGGVMHHTDR